MKNTYNAGILFDEAFQDNCGSVGVNEVWSELTEKFLKNSGTSDELGSLFAKLQGASARAAFVKGFDTAIGLVINSLNAAS